MIEDKDSAYEYLEKKYRDLRETADSRLKYSFFKITKNIINFISNYWTPIVRSYSGDVTNICFESL